MSTEWAKRDSPPSLSYGVLANLRRLLWPLDQSTAAANDTPQAYDTLGIDATCGICAEGD